MKKASQACAEGNLRFSKIFVPILTLAFLGLLILIKLFSNNKMNAFIKKNNKSGK
jgi:hypothetical protein